MAGWTLSFTCCFFMAAPLPCLVHRLLTAPLAGLRHLKAPGSLAYCDDIWVDQTEQGELFLIWCWPDGLCPMIAHTLITPSWTLQKNTWNTHEYRFYFNCIYTAISNENSRQEQESMLTEHSFISKERGHSYILFNRIWSHFVPELIFKHWIHDLEVALQTLSLKHSIYLLFLQIFFTSKPFHRIYLWVLAFHVITSLIKRSQQ